MAGKVYLYNPTISNLKIKINDDAINDNGARFLAAATKETNWAPRLADEAVDRDLEVSANRVGKGENKFYIFRDVERDDQLQVKGVAPMEMKVWIDPNKFQLAEDLVMYLLFENGEYGYVLLDDEGEAKHILRP